MTGVMSLCGAASVATAGDKDWQWWAESPGRGFPFGGKGSKPQVSRSRFRVQRPRGFHGSEKSHEKTSLVILA